MSSDPSARGYFSRTGHVRVQVEAQRASHWRAGEDAPFATLTAVPARVAATADAREVVAVLHGGVVRWNA